MTAALRLLTEEETQGAVPELAFDPEQTRAYGMDGPEAERLVRLAEYATRSVSHAGAAMAALLDLYAADPRRAQRARFFLLNLA